MTARTDIIYGWNEGVGDRMQIVAGVGMQSWPAREGPDIPFWERERLAMRTAQALLSSHLPVPHIHTFSPVVYMQHIIDSLFQEPSASFLPLTQN